MPKIQLDASEATSFTRSDYIVPGIVLFEALKFEEKQSSKGSPALILTCRVVQTEPGKEGEVGKTMSRWLMLSGKGAGFTVDYFRAMGSTKVTAGAMSSIDTDKYLGRLFGASIQDDEAAEDRQGRPVQRSEISTVFTPDEFEARIAAIARARPAAVAVPAARPTNGRSAPVADLDDEPTADLADDDDEL